MISETVVLPNQVAALDRARTEAGSAAASLEQDFETLRAELGLRLQAQAALQRRVMDLVATLRTPVTTLGAPTLEQLDTMLQAADVTIAEIASDRELPSLPKQLMPELVAARSQLQSIQISLSARAAAVAAREQALTTL